MYTYIQKPTVSTTLVIQAELTNQKGNLQRYHPNAASLARHSLHTVYVFDLECNEISKASQRSGKTNKLLATGVRYIANNLILRGLAVRELGCTTLPFRFLWRKKQWVKLHISYPIIVLHM